MPTDTEDYDEMVETALGGKTAYEAEARKTGSRLGFLQPKKKPLDRARAERQAKRAGKLRVALPLLALSLLALIWVWPMIAPNKIAHVVMKNIPDLVIRNLHFNGLDSKNQPYTLSAVTATRPAGQTDIYDLDKPEGDILLTNGSWLAGKATYGRYDQSTRRLWLGGKVQLFQDKGYQFTTSEAQVNIADSFAWGEKPVLIQGDFGTITGQGFRLLDDGSVMVVTGPAKATLNLHQGTASDKPAGAQ